MNAPLRIFAGFDPRQPVAYNVLQHSILSNSSKPVAITPLSLKTLPIKRMGLTEFTYSRYLVPWLCDYAGMALFLDADMVVDFDIADLFAAAQPGSFGVWVAQDKPRFEWPSLMLFNCDRCTLLTPELIETGVPQRLEAWAEGGVGNLPIEWSYCVGYNHEECTPKLIHYTAGIPIWPETRDCKFADVWHKYHQAANGSVSFQALMGTSVHTKKVASGEINR